MNPHQPYHIRRFPLRPRSVVTPPAQKERVAPATPEKRVSFTVQVTKKGENYVADHSDALKHVVVEAPMHFPFRQSQAEDYCAVMHAYIERYGGKYPTHRIENRDGTDGSFSLVFQYLRPAKPASRTPAPLSPRLREALQRTCPKPRTKATP